MHDERQHAEYDRTSAIVAKIHNANFSERVTAAELNPYEQDELDNSLDPTYSGAWDSREEYDAAKERQFDMFVRTMCRKPGTGEST